MPGTSEPTVPRNPKNFWVDAAPMLLSAMLMWFAAFFFWYGFILYALRGQLSELLADHPLDPLWLVGSTLTGGMLALLLVKAHREYARR